MRTILISGRTYRDASDPDDDGDGGEKSSDFLIRPCHEAMQDGKKFLELKT